MEPRISIITLAVKDLKKSITFYKKLGFTLANDGKQIAFFKMKGTQLALYPRDKTAEDIGIKLTKTGFPGFTLAHNVRSKEVVRKTLIEAKKAGAVIVKEAQDVFWGGYSGYFKDPDGFYWEVAWNPEFKIK